MYRFFLFFSLILIPCSVLADPLVDSLNNLAWEISNQDFERSASLLQQALARAEQLDYLKGKSTSYNQLGLLYREKGLYEDAEAFFFKALAARKAIPDSLGIAKVYENLSFVKTGQGDYEQAIFYSLEAIKVVESMQLYGELGQFYLNLAIAYKRNKDIDEAFSFYHQALDFYKLDKDSFNLGNTMYNMANLYRDERQLDSAQHLYEGALNIYKAIRDSIGMGLTYMGMGTVLYYEDNLSGAENMFKTSMDIYLRLKNDLYLYYSYSNLIDLYNEIKDYDQALAYCQRSEVILEQVGGHHEKWLLATQFSTIYDSLSQYREAFQYQQKASILRDSMFNEEKNRLITETQIKYGVEILKRENAEQEVENQQKTTQVRMAIGVAVFFLLSLLAGYLYYRYRKRTFRIITQQNEKIHQQQVDELMKSQEISFIGARLAGQDSERKRIARELHDGVGSMLVAVKWQYDHAMETIKKDDEGVEALERANLQLSQTYEEFRKVASNISAGNVQRIGLLSAVNDLCNTISGSGKIQANLSSFGTFESLDEATEMSLYRVIQELISNTLKHAKASKIDIQLNMVEKELNLIVEDNGKGFETNQIENKGMGVKSIEERVEALNGFFDIDSGKGAGTTIIINIPIVEQLTL